jgi:hypothetical protein
MDKASLLESIKVERARLGALLETLDEETFTWTPMPGTWSAKDNIAHLNHWESAMIANLGRIARGEEAQHEPGTVDEQNARLYRENASLPAGDVLAAFRQNGRDLLAVLEPFPEALLFAVGKFAWQLHEKPARFFVRATPAGSDPRTACAPQPARRSPRIAMPRS